MFSGKWTRSREDINTRVEVLQKCSTFYSHGAFTLFSISEQHFLCGCTDVNSHQLLIYAWNTSHDRKLCSYVLHPSDSLVVIPPPPPRSLSASVHPSLSPPPPPSTVWCSYDLSGLWRICLYRDWGDAAAHVRLAMHLLKCSNPMQESTQKRKTWVTLAFDARLRACVQITVCGCGDVVTGWSREGGAVMAGWRKSRGRNQRKTAPSMIYWSGITELFPTERRGRWRDKLPRGGILRGKG